MTKAVKHQALNTFNPYAVFYRTGGQIEKFHFLNGWGASVANHDGSYGGDEGLYELAEINPNGHIVDDSIKGWLTFAEVDSYLRERLQNIKRLLRIRVFVPESAIIRVTTPKDYVNTTSRIHTRRLLS